MEWLWLHVMNEYASAKGKGNGIKSYRLTIKWAYAFGKAWANVFMLLHIIEYNGLWYDDLMWMYDLIWYKYMAAHVMEYGLSYPLMW